MVERAGGGAGRLRDTAPALLEQEGVVEGADKGEGEEVLEQLPTERRATCDGRRLRVGWISRGGAVAAAGDSWRRRRLWCWWWRRRCCTLSCFLTAFSAAT